MFVFLKFVFSGGSRLKSIQTDGETLCRAPEAKDARSDQVEFCSQGPELWTFRFWCYTVQTAPASPPCQYFFPPETSCEVKVLLYRSSSLPGLCLLCSSLRLCEVFWLSPDNTQQTHKIKCQRSLFLIKHSALTDSAPDSSATWELPVIENEHKKKLNCGAHTAPDYSGNV